MDFTKEIASFPSAVHNNIYSTARGVTPLEKSLVYVDDPELRLSCTDYHSFYMDMLSDMYEHPEAYFMPVMALENFCAGRKINGLKQKFPSKTKAILARTRNSVQGYILTFWMLGTMEKISGKNLLVADEIMSEIEKRTNSGVSPISLENRLRALKRVGLVFENNQLSSKNYPNMFSAMCALASKSKKSSGFDYFNFSNLEFRNLNKKYKPSYDDYFAPLPEVQRKQAFDLHEFATEKKINPMISTFWKVEYKYTSAQVMCIGSAATDSHEGMLDIRVIGTYNWDDSELINQRLERESSEFQKQALRHIWRCNACSTSHLGMFVCVLGKRQRVCGGGLIGFRWCNPSEDDLKIIKRLIEIRCEILDEINEAKRKG